ncbi:MAG: RES family NAD+ phosphorylase [Cytophagales bacterium]|nr:RES family NAD+ phosphorylase [Cytophagales bacterium]
MILYHLDKWKYREHWPPEGTLYAAGRWNKPRQWIIYTSPTISLAKLEILANRNNLPINYVCMTLEVSDDADIQTINYRSLPNNWMDKPYPPDLVQFTTKFLTSGKLLLKVPSAQSHSESNFLINVRHPAFYDNVKLLDVAIEPFDPRLKTH